MTQFSQKRIQLPEQILAQVEIQAPLRPRRSAPQNSITARKVQRKADRVGKRRNNGNFQDTIQRRRARTANLSKSTPSNYPTEIQVEPVQDLLEPKRGRWLSSSEPVNPEHRSSSLLDTCGTTTTREAKRRLAADDAEILVLEQKLGLKKSKRLPKSFVDDGLHELIGSLAEEAPMQDGQLFGEPDVSARLAEKNREPLKQNATNSRPKPSPLRHIDVLKGSRRSQELATAIPVGECRPRPHQEVTEPSSHGNQQNESPSASLHHEQTISADSGKMNRLQKLLRGIINRVSEATVLSLLSEFELLHKDYPRHHVHSMYSSLILEQVGIFDLLTDAFIIVHSAFIAAIVKVTGHDFAAEVVQRLASSLDSSLNMIEADARQSKRSLNLMTLLTHLFNTKVISSELVYDFLRRFVDEVSENNTLLLLRVMKSSGPQLRQENPAALKEIVLHLKLAVTHIEPKALSIRTKFMIETMTDLKNKKEKAGFNSSGVTMEHLRRIKKLLGSIEQHRIKASDPLRISLADILDDNKKGQWWLAGARRRVAENKYPKAQRADGRSDEDRSIEMVQQLALEQRMNTDIRRSIFTSIMSASDFNDAHQRLLGLRLKKSQEMEIPKILMHCVAAEQNFNPYYVFVAEKLCSDRQLRIAFQISFWGALRQIETAETEAESTYSHMIVQSNLKPVLHLAMFFAELVALQALDIKVIKNIVFDSAQSELQAFLEVFLVTICLRSYRKSSRKLERRLRLLLRPLKDDLEKTRAIARFLKIIRQRSDIIALADRAKLIETCDMACYILLGQESSV